MATGRETSYNYNNGAYSASGYPFPGGQLKLQASYSTSVYDAENLQSVVYVAITLYNIGIDWEYQTGREVSIYWNNQLITTFVPPGMHVAINIPHTTSVGSASFVVQHNADGTCTGELKVEWASTVLQYTVSGVTINVTELGCKATVTPETISGGTVPTDVFSINGKSFLSIVQKDGLDVSRAEVNKKSVITMDGTEWASEKKRHTISVKLMDMSSEQFSEYAAYLATNPAAVVYTDSEDGLVHNGTFYISNIRHVKRKVITGVTYLTGLSFDLSEKTAT